MKDDLANKTNKFRDQYNKVLKHQSDAMQVDQEPDRSQPGSPLQSLQLIVNKECSAHGSPFFDLKYIELRNAKAALRTTLCELMQADCALNNVLTRARWDLFLLLGYCVLPCFLKYSITSSSSICNPVILLCLLQGSEGSFGETQTQAKG